MLNTRFKTTRFLSVRSSFFSLPSLCKLFRWCNVSITPKFLSTNKSVIRKTSEFHRLYIKSGSHSPGFSVPVPCQNPGGVKASRWDSLVLRWQSVGIAVEQEFYRDGIAWRARFQSLVECCRGEWKREVKLTGEIGGRYTYKNVTCTSVSL